MFVSSTNASCKDFLAYVMFCEMRNIIKRDEVRRSNGEKKVQMRNQSISHLLASGEDREGKCIKIARR